MDVRSIRICPFLPIGFPDFPYIYFEVVSRGSWDRYRCEGLTYHCLPIAKPGSYKYSLPCFRLSDGVKGELRRFFIGDCSNYNDITWVGLPKSIEVSKTFFFVHFIDFFLFDFRAQYSINTAFVP